jgi:hypothetical protein
METKNTLIKVRLLLLFFIVSLVVSGVTALPLRFELGLLDSLFGSGTFMEDLIPSLAGWISLVHQALDQTTEQYPFLAYGTDWLAFGHFVIAIAFIGPLKDPVKNLWVIEFGMIACVLVVPYALVFGQVRGIPILWRGIDTLFGIIGLIPLWITRKHILRLSDERSTTETETATP